MKNVTVSLADDLYHKARVEAARRNTTVSALVREYLIEIAEQESPSEKLKRQELALREQIVSFSGSARLGRDEMYERTT